MISSYSIVCVPGIHSSTLLVCPHGTVVHETTNRASFAWNYIPILLISILWPELVQYNLHTLTMLKSKSQFIVCLDSFMRSYSISFILLCFSVKVSIVFIFFFLFLWIVNL